MYTRSAGFLAATLIVGATAAAPRDGRHNARPVMDRPQILAETRQGGRDLFLPPISAVLIYLSIMSIGSPPVITLPD